MCYLSPSCHWPLKIFTFFYLAHKIGNFGLHNGINQSSERFSGIYLLTIPSSIAMDSVNDSPLPILCLSALKLGNFLTGILTKLLH